MAEVARALGGACLRPEQIVAAIGKPRKQVMQTVGRMVISGHVQRVEAGGFRLSAEGKRRLDSGERFRPGPRGPYCKERRPRSGNFRQRAWNAMRIKKRFSVDDIVTLCARPTDKFARASLHRFLRMLSLAGYLSKRPERVRDGRPGSNGYIVFRLEKDTGPIAPRVAQDRKSIFDHNTKERVSWEA